MLLFALAFFVFCFSLFFKYKDRILPVSASQHGATLDWLFNFNIIIISSVWFITNALLFYFAFRYYRRNNRNLTAFFFPQSHKLELIWTVIPGITLFVIIFLGIKTWSQITAPSEGESIIIELYAKQFDWTARYAGKDNQLGRRNFRLITADNPMGLDYSDPHVKDDIIVRNEFHIPKGKQVSFVFGSRDVIHSAYMPHFRAQMNCVPGMTTFFHFTPTISTEEMRKNPKVIGNVEEINKLLAERGEESSYEFNFLLLCNKICGVSHYNMQMNIIVDETEQQFNQWLSKQKTVGEQLRTDVTQKP
jgi:cytochrome c oxidase subunit 2